MEILTTITPYLLIAFILVIPIIFGLLISMLLKKPKSKRKPRKIKVKGYLEQENIETFLRKNGAGELFSGKINYQTFMVLKILMAILIGLVFIKLLGLWALIIGIPLGFFALDLMIYLSNKSDNSKMDHDLMMLYNVLKIQTNASVFITDALIECHRLVSTKRLKKGLLVLNSQLIARAIPEIEAIKEFNSKFNNKRIDNLCAILIQAVSSGQSIHALEDISQQMVDIQKATSLRQRENMKRNFSVLEFLLFVGVIGIVIFGLFSSMDVLTMF